MRRVTINDVAAKAGISKATVSHVVNNTRFVENETRQRVLRVIEELGYQPSSVARSLTTNRTGTIGVIVSDVTNDFFGEVLHGIEDISRPEGYSLVVCNTDEILEREDHFIDLLLGQRVDGIIAAATSKRWDALSKAAGQQTPLVFVDRMFEGLTGPFVGVNNFDGARKGTEHLISSGHTKIGILAGFPRLSTMVERLAGFRYALDNHHIPVNEDWVVPTPLNIDAGRDAAIHLLQMQDRPTALFINNNLLTLGALLAIKQLGLHVPEDLAVIGFDDHPWASVANPPLTVIRQPARQIGQTAANILRERINGVDNQDASIQLECELVLRQSCCSCHPSFR